LLCNWYEFGYTWAKHNREVGRWRNGPSTDPSVDLKKWSG
jgi:hypothetical protein